MRCQYRFKGRCYQAIGLIEAMLVLALAALVTIVSLHYYTEVRLKEDVTVFIGQVHGILKASLSCVEANTNSGNNTLSDINNTCALANLISENTLSSYYARSPWGENSTEVTSQGNPSVPTLIVFTTGNPTGSAGCAYLRSSLLIALPPGTTVQCGEGITLSVPLA